MTRSASPTVGDLLRLDLAEVSLVEIHLALPLRDVDLGMFERGDLSRAREPDGRERRKSLARGSEAGGARVFRVPPIHAHDQNVGLTLDDEVECVVGRLGHAHGRDPESVEEPLDRLDPARILVDDDRRPRPLSVSTFDTFLARPVGQAKAPCV